MTEVEFIRTMQWWSRPSGKSDWILSHPWSIKTLTSLKYWPLPLFPPLIMRNWLFADWALAPKITSCFISNEGRHSSSTKVWHLLERGDPPPQMVGCVLFEIPPTAPAVGSGNFGRFLHFDIVESRSTISTVLVQEVKVHPSPTSIFELPVKLKERKLL